MTPAPAVAAGSWRRELTAYHWWVLAVAALGWSFDTMDQRIFILARAPAMSALLPAGTAAGEVTYYSGMVTAIFMLGWAIGGFAFGILGDRWGRAKTMMLTILLYLRVPPACRRSRKVFGTSLSTASSRGLGVGGEFKPPESRWSRRSCPLPHARTRSVYCNPSGPSGMWWARWVEASS